ncbi:MFS transporter [Criibacterium bergeronii]|uniref:MFS transporter n=1 Tax=Criibacterium bergeronii TaxID=1871336 RepID=A0A371IN51_9FIRM|nr:glycoside-pentoside-hexuronide (GPH):cation symporter [Criibacterium bergeronii]RDY21856.1 MFS transporter [Criibacterium bergeronii]TRW24913.1 MFS transporter [Criibacterium bergeronii]
MDKTRAKNLPSFGIKDKIGYMFGDFGNDFTFILSSTFLMKFYTDIMGVGPAAIGTMMLLARIVDAFTDIGMGRIVDKTTADKGDKFKRWIRRFMGPVALASFLLYPVWFKDMSMPFKTIWMYVTYLLWGSICYTGVNIPYGSMASAITDKPDERTQLSSFRTMGAQFAQLAIGVIGPLIIYYKDAAGEVVFSGEKMAIFALVCSVLAIICYILCLNWTTERVKIEKANDNEETSSVLDVFKNMVSSRALLGLILCAILLLLVNLGLLGMSNYIYPNYFKDATAMSKATLLATFLVLGLTTVTPKLSGALGKKEISAIGAVLGAAAGFVAYFMKITDVNLWFAFYALMMVGIGVFNIVVWAMIIDVIDDIEVKTGSRDDGTIYGSYSFARKLGQAASSGVTGYLLAAIGYSKATANDPAVLQGIYDITTLFPAIVLALLALALTFIYPLSKKRVDENAEILRIKRELSAK